MSVVAWRGDKIRSKPSVARISGHCSAHRRMNSMKSIQLKCLGIQRLYFCSISSLSAGRGLRRLVPGLQEHREGVKNLPRIVPQKRMRFDVLTADVTKYIELYRLHFRMSSRFVIRAAESWDSNHDIAARLATMRSHKDLLISRIQRSKTRIWFQRCEIYEIHDLGGLDLACTSAKRDEGLAFV